MGAVLPKIKKYVWLSIICLMLNLSVFVSVFIGNQSSNIDNFLSNDPIDEIGFEGALPENESANIQNFALSSGGSFVPFFSLIPLALMGDDLPLLLTTFAGIVILIISIMQVLILSAIIMNYIPKVLGSGFDV